MVVEAVVVVVVVVVVIVVAAALAAVVVCTVAEAGLWRLDAYLTLLFCI